MANLKMPKDEKEIRSMTASDVRKSYIELADTYKKILDDELVRCVNCGEWLARSNFYISKKYKSGFYPVCKENTFLKNTIAKHIFLCYNLKAVYRKRAVDSRLIVMRAGLHRVSG